MLQAAIAGIRPQEQRLVLALGQDVEAVASGWSCFDGPAVAAQDVPEVLSIWNRY
jgi:hypothetical protein